MNTESIIINIKLLRKELKHTDFENIPELKSKVLAVYEQLVLLEHSNAKNSVDSPQIQEPKMIPSTVIENEIVDEAALKTEVLKPSIEVLIQEKNSIEESVIKVLEQEEVKETLETAVLEVETPQEEIIKEPEITAPIIHQEPELLHELESITEGFELPEFEPAPTLNSIQDQPKSLNEILNKSVQIGLNDRIAFINQLFDSNQEDYTRVISQVNTMQNPDEVISFINMFVKPEYNNWQDKGAIEERFIQVVLKRFEA